MKTQYHEFKGPTMIAIGRKQRGVVLGDENRCRKNQTNVFDFLGVIFVTHRGFCDDCDGGEEECVGGWVM